jgi:lysophospholipid acyltransferase (LPLAT)-like uncharacterized protein
MKKLLRSAALQGILTHLLVGLLVAYGRFFLLTCRVKVITPVPDELKKEPVMLALWHQQLMGATLVHQPNPFPLLALMSASRDGALTRGVGRHFGVEAAVGSSHRGARAAALNMVKQAHGKSLFVTPDGPRGPAHVAKAGATGIARLAGLPVVPCAVGYSRQKTFGSWDNFQFPLPFTAVFIAYGTPQKNMTDKELTQQLNILSTQVEHATTLDKPHKVS